MKIYTGFIAFISVIYFVSSEKVIGIESGKIIGEELEDFYAYRGIPYAKAPIGKLRFSPPKKYSKKWEGVREFKNFSDVCAQYDHLTYHYAGSEDCLKLNVFVPKAVAESQQKAPVIFYIHGGAFMFGGGSYYLPDNIMKAQNMILVTVNYRLGILGFLSTEDEVIPGNFGLKDQVEALRWVQKNIGAFNGDRNKVTIVGYSAGGASVQLHYMTPQTDGLFNNGISHSGVALNPWVMMENAKEKAHKLATLAECPEDHEKLLECLREKPVTELVVFADNFFKFLYNPFSPFGVVVEAPSATAFLTDHPLNILKSGHFKKRAWLLSQTQDEGLYPSAEFYDEGALAMINEKWEELAPHILDFNGTTKHENRKIQVAKKIRQRYLGNAVISKENFIEFDNIISDRLFKHGAYKAIRLQSRLAPAYFYYFRYKSQSGLAEHMSQSKDYIGISHGEDVLLIYWHELRPNLPYSEEELEVGQKLISLYYNFAKHDKPVYDDLELEKVTPKKVSALEITKSAKIVELDDQFGKGEFWDEVEKILESEDRTFYDEL